MSARVDQIVAMARAEGATVVESAGATIIVLAVASAADPGEHLSLEQACHLGRLQSKRQIKEAARRGELALYGTERTRTVKRGDLTAWLETRRSPVSVVEQGQATRVEARLGRSKRRGTTSRRGSR